MKTLAILALPLLACSALTQTVRITFDGPPPQPRNTQYAIAQYQEAGMLFKPLGPIDTAPPFRLTRNGGGLSFYPDNGTAYLQSASGDSLEFLPTDRTLFDLISVDLAEYSTVFTLPKSVTFLGFKANGQMVAQTFTTDGIIDGTGPVQDFQTFSFSPRWKHLVRVEVQPNLYSLDNLVIRKRLRGPDSDL
jgi:hypothetical protein